MVYENLIIFLGKYLILVPPLLIITTFFLLDKHDKKRILLVCFVGGILSLLLALLASQIYFNERPFVVRGIEPLIPHEPDNGFPSNHFLLASTISSVLFLFSKRISVISWIFTLLIGLGRVLAFVHNPIDLLGSLIISVFSIFIVSRILK